ncbi:MAG TPA: AAA family ATPase [Polyangia bacterium]|nr:AAA family ATPase [Polyangia bacterium]
MPASLAIPGYRLHTCLYESRRSFVWRGVRLADERPAILKIHRQESPSPEEVALYQREFEILRTLDEPSVARVYELIKLHHRLILVLEDIGGQPLGQRLQRGGLDVARFLEVALRLCASVGVLHQNRIIHNDLNPANILLTPGGDRLQLIDFGSATTLSAALTTFQNLETLEGTLAYMSPEQTGRTGRSLDQRSDLYSLGAVFHHMLTGHPPFSAPDAAALVFAHLTKEPEPVEALVPGIPPVLARLVRKLLSKNPEDRYQGVWGLQADLARCQAELQHPGQDALGDFPLGTEDLPDTLHFPSRLYGRERETARMLEILESVRHGGTELLAMAGYSGIGKTALVQELYRPLTGYRGLFASGKFDQLRKNVPFDAVRSALKELVRQTLTTDEGRLAALRQRLGQALAGRGQVLLEVIPELELLLGPQEPVPVLGPSDSQARFNQVFQAFLRVFCSAEQPLVIFLDDLQWADRASLLLLELMLTDPELHHLLVIVAYRDNEVSDTHPLLLLLRRLEKESLPVHRMVLTPLGREALTALLADTLKCEPGTVRPLAELLQRKTEGNPFFVHHFLQLIHHEKLLTFDYAAHRWSWQLSSIEAQSITENVVALMVRRLQQLPATAQDVLRLAACLGNRFELDALAIVYERSPAETFRDLRPPLDAGFVLPASSLEVLASRSHASMGPDADEARGERRPVGLSGSTRGSGALDGGGDTQALLVRRFRFVHDRVQQAAHALIPASERAALHLRIGRLLLDNLSPAQQAERLFEVADHLNQGSALIVEPAERLGLVRLNLEAGKRAEAATAYAAASGYVEAAAAHVDEALWREQYELALELNQLRARVAYLCGDFEKAEEIIHTAGEHAQSAPDKAELYAILLVQYTLRTRYAEAIRVGRHALGLLGVALPEDTEDLEAARDAAMAEVDRALAGRPIACLAELPLVTAREQRIAMRLLSALGPPCYRSHPRLWGVVVATAARLSLEFGNAPQVSYTYPGYGGLLAFVRHDYASTREFGEVALRLSEKFGEPQERCVFLLMAGSSVTHWSAPLKAATASYLAGYEVGIGSGNLQYAAYCLGHNLYCRFFQGAAAADWREEIATARAFAKEKQNQWAIDLADGCWLLAQRMTGQSAAGAGAARGDEGPPEVDEREYIARLEQRNLQPLCIYYIMKARLLLLLGDAAAAAALCEEVEPLLLRVATQGLLPWPEHRFTQCLVYAELLGPQDVGERARMQERLAAYHELLQKWAAHCPANFQHKELLVQAEVARLRGEGGAALACYVRAVEAARCEGFIQHAALASELAARLLQQQGRERLAVGYLYEAQHAYARWGAIPKLEQIERQLSQLETLGPSLTTGGEGHQMGGTTVTQLEALAVIKASQVLSGQMVMGRLLESLMSFVIEHTGAERGALLLADRQGLTIAAEATLERQGIRVRMQSGEWRPEGYLPVSVLNYVRRSWERVILADAVEAGPFAADEYLCRVRPKSVLCLPIIRQTELVGLLYLENHLVARAFTPDRLAVLEVLAAQSAISIENARLYAEVQRAEAALRLANDELERRVEERTRELKEAQARLVDTARAAGMTEIASNVLHSVGNALNSTVIALDQMRDSEKASRLGRIGEVATMLEQHRGALADFLTQDPRGRRLPDYIAALSKELLRERAQLRENLETMAWHIEHIRAVVEVQQNYAKTTLFVDECDLSKLVEDVLRIQTPALRRHGIAVRSEATGVCKGRVDRHKVLQILLNLISNAKYALTAVPQEQRHLLVRLSADGVRAQIQVVDTGTGIAPEDQARLFSHGFTTRQDGHGFGLHSSALAAQLLGGTLTLQSDGVGKGTTATLELPLHAPPQTNTIAQG